MVMMSEPHPDTMDWRDAAYLDVLPLRVGDAEREARRVLARAERVSGGRGGYCVADLGALDALPAGREGRRCYSAASTLAEVLRAAVADGGLLDQMAGGAR